jgi:hypothetical protein
MLNKKNLFIFLFIIAVIAVGLFSASKALKADVPGGSPCKQGYMCWYDNVCDGECWFFSCLSDICYNVPRFGAECGICVTT